MPQACPHCGSTLPAVIDAYCPECREDLSATPGAPEPPPLSPPVYTSLSDDMRYLANTTTVTRWTIVALIATGASAIMLVVGLIEANWEAVIAASIIFLLSVAWVVVWYRAVSVKTNVSGREKTTKGSEPTK